MLEKVRIPCGSGQLLCLVGVNRMLWGSEAVRGRCARKLWEQVVEDEQSERQLNVGTDETKWNRQED